MFAMKNIKTAWFFSAVVGLESLENVIKMSNKIFINLIESHGSITIKRCNIAEKHRVTSNISIFMGKPDFRFPNTKSTIDV